MISNGDRIQVFPWHFHYIQMFIFLLFVCVDLWGPTPESETSVSELPLLFAIAFFLIEICISSDSRDNSDTEWLTCKKWPRKVNTYNEGKNLVCGCQVFCKEIKSNAVSKLFILIWSYEWIKVMNLGLVNSDGKLSITLKFEFCITLV